MGPDRFFGQFGFSRRPVELGGEGLFSFRLRSEFGLGVPYRDPNALRERLYRAWRQRLLGTHRPLRAPRAPRYDYSYVKGTGH